AARAVWASHVEVRERTVHLATLGRLSAQMAHDIRNPLAAIRGAAQYLDEERKRGGALEDSAEFLTLILEQTERLDKVVSDYRRLGRAEPAFETAEVPALLARVLSNARLIAEREPTIQVEGHPPVEALTWSLDPELVTTALENLVRNAVEAMPDGGTIHIDSKLGGRTLSLRVSDDGPGMDARTREQSSQSFFTTKATGSGLGLAFARRVAEAHGGRLHIESAPGRGTSVTLVLARGPGG
ncbi:MAG TPA: two-component sensor histidine kinase, partial [Polyangiaceae bacterium]|nr:two-component sensor histidine kinase [Polyangiaceae bacterium]